MESAARLAVSDRWTDRLAAGHLLAHESGDEQVDALLRHLLHDQHDTAVTEATAEALLGRHDITGVDLTLEAWRDADDHTGEHLGDVLLRVCHDPGTDPGSFDTELLAVRTARPELADVVDEVRGWLGPTTVELVAPHEEIVIRPYCHSDAGSWLRCRVLSFLPAARSRTAAAGTGAPPGRGGATAQRDLRRGGAGERTVSGTDWLTVWDGRAVEVLSASGGPTGRHFFPGSAQPEDAGTTTTWNASE